MAQDDNQTEQESNEVPELEDVDKLLKSEYPLFAVVGVLGALSVYLFDFRKGAPNQFVDFGVGGALLMFLVASFVLVRKLFDQLRYAREIDWYRLLPIGLLLTGLIAVMYGIAGVGTAFLGEIVMLLGLGLAGTLFVGYMIYFPHEKFDDVTGVPQDRAKRISDAQHHGGTVAVLVILFSGLIFPELPKIDGYNPLLVIPAVILAIGAHYITSFGLRWYHLRNSAE